MTSRLGVTLQAVCVGLSFSWLNAVAFGFLVELFRWQENIGCVS